MKSAWRLAAIALTLVIGFVIGYVAASQRGRNSELAALRAEAAGNLSQRLEILSLLRMGDADRAVAQLEQQVDTLTLTLAANHVDPSVLSAVKAYRADVPAQPARRAQLDAAFAMVPALRDADCPSALRTFLVANAARAGGAKH